eukprot:TRINITY_DN2607_c0_g2_i1.p2 TRINITY_DN2607_c0_g2~~TRINITY_DN2607_c0_g2_i1.p2  ORF type:complete len:154 (-),score=26.89 TRINITY_DN2607_c0_g2_i1:116-577(-)
MTRGADELFAEYDILITPAMPCKSYRINEYYGKGNKERPWDVFTPQAFLFPFNVSGHAALVVPIGYDYDSMPVGVQVVAKRSNPLYDDSAQILDSLLWVGQQLAQPNEVMRPWWPLMALEGVEGLPCSKDGHVERIRRAIGKRGPSDPPYRNG